MLGNKLWQRLCLTFVIGLAFFPGAVGTLYGLQEWQTSSFPIIDRFEVRRAGFGKDGALAMRGILRKRFGFCRFEAIQWWVVMPDGLQERVGWDSADQDPTIPNNRPEGLQSFGPWTIYVQKFPQAETLYGLVDHVCLGVWPTRTLLGPISLILLRSRGIDG
jgi:hypothetical protein